MTQSTSEHLRPPFRFVTASWAVFGVVYAAVWTLSADRPAEYFRWIVPVVVSITAVWWAVTPLVLRAAVRAAPSRVGWWRSVALHAALLLGIAVAVTAARRMAVVAFTDYKPEAFTLVLLYWLDVWFFAYLALVAAALAFAERLRLRERASRAGRLAAELARSKRLFLETQLQPHFLFNALNTIQELGHEAPAAAARTLQRLRTLLSQSLERHGQAEVTLDEELDGLEPYLDIQRTRFSNWLTVEVAVEPAAGEAMVPYLMLQPLVENAIRHGLAVRQGAGRVFIQAVRRGDRLCVTVQDDGVGLKTSSPMQEGIGLANVAERLRQLHAENQRFDVRNGSEGGVEVAIDLPYSTRPAANAAESVPLTNDAVPAAKRSVFTVRAALAILGLGLALALVWINQMVLVTSTAADMELNLARVVPVQLVGGASWVLLAPLVFRMVQKWPLTSRAFLRLLPLHAALALTSAAVHLAALSLAGFNDWVFFSPALVNPILGDLLIYAGVVAYAHLSLYRAGYLAHDLDAARLTASLAESRFQALRVQVRPAFILSTLEHLEGMVRRDPDGAERLVARLADTLRSTLDAGRETTTTVSRELERIAVSIDAHQLGVRPGVTFDVRAVPEVLQQLIPSRIICATVDELLANAEGNPASPLNVEVEVSRVLREVGMPLTRVVVQGSGEGLGPVSVSHSWWRPGGLADRAAAEVSDRLSIHVPDRNSVVLEIREPLEGSRSTDEVLQVAG